MKIRTYSELKRLKTFEERYQYLRLAGIVGESTFGYDRYLNQILYNSKRWKRTRDSIIVRDHGCDLGVNDKDHEIYGRIIIHHMNVISIEDIENCYDKLFDPELLITTSNNTHLAIHFGSESLLPQMPIERRPNDMCPWR
jgi:hypothetical protein